MNGRKTSDADVQRIVNFHKYPSQEVSMINQTGAWSVADFLYALDRIDVEQPGQPMELRDQLRLIYHKLRVEREAAEARAAAEAASAKRHAEISRHLEELKKPHWSVAPNFWMTLVILILTFFGVVVAFLGLRR